MSKLTEKQKFFCREYLRDFNATQAAIRAGYSKISAKQIGTENLAKHDLQHYIQKLTDDINERTDNDILRIINELQLIAFGSLKDVAEWDAYHLTLRKSEELEDEARIISEVSESKSEAGSSMKIKLYDKLKALELLGKYHKIWSDKEIPKDSEIKVKIAYDRSEN